MLYHIIYPLSKFFTYANIFKYITLRSFLAFIIACLISILFGEKFIAYMKKRQFGQIIREDGPSSHKKKAGTPTFGGVIIGLAILSALAICGNFSSLPFVATLVVMVAYFLLGFWDDYLKILKKNSKGVSARGKLIWQFSIAALAIYLLIRWQIIDTKLYVPFLKNSVADLGWFYILFGSLVVVGSSNAVNLTDGLDGLAMGPIMTGAFSLGFFAYIIGHRALSTYLLIPYFEHVGELTVLASAILGAGVGFLWYNFYPAQIFMGDVGSLSLGGGLGMLAVVTKNEILFVLIGGVFVVEALSVMIQVGSFKLRGKRVFKMAPIHHHFELLGWPEPKVTIRFWIISIVLAMMSLATLKIR